MLLLRCLPHRVILCEAVNQSWRDQGHPSAPRAWPGSRFKTYAEHSHSDGTLVRVTLRRQHKGDVSHPATLTSPFAGLTMSRMPKLSAQQIQQLARSIITASPGGIRYSVLVERSSEQNPETPKNTVHGSVWNLDALFPNEIAKPSRGLFLPRNQTMTLSSWEVRSRRR